MRSQGVRAPSLCDIVAARVSVQCSCVACDGACATLGVVRLFVHLDVSLASRRGSLALVAVTSSMRVCAGRECNLRLEAPGCRAVVLAPVSSNLTIHQPLAGGCMMRGAPERHRTQNKLDRTLARWERGESSARVAVAAQLTTECCDCDPRCVLLVSPLLCRSPLRSRY